MRLCGLLLQLFVLGTVVCFAADKPGASAPAPTPEQAKVPEVQDSPGVDVLIANLAAESYQVREEATRKLWEMGTAALEPLKKAMQGDDPEIIFRASGLVRNIEHHITPDTDPALIVLVERYFKAGPDDKKEILKELWTRRGWHQYLKLYEGETDATVRDSMRAEAHGIALIAAREKLLEDAPQEALKFLELAPRDNQSLMSIAAFHRAQGTLDAELERAKGLPGEDGARLRAALFRTVGNLEEARKAALEANETLLASEIALHQGDPLPWLALIAKTGSDHPLRMAYLATISRKWKGEAVQDSDLEPIVKILSARDDGLRASAMGALFLLGKPALAEAALSKMFPLQASQYFDSIERIPEAMAMLGLDAHKPDFTAWVAKRFGRISRDDEDSTVAMDELMTLASLLTRLGLYSELQAAFEKPMQHLAEEDEDTFVSVIERLFSEDRPSIRRVAPELGRDLATRWAGADMGRWNTLVSLVFEEDEMLMEWWDWTATLDPKATVADRFDGMLSLLSYTRDPKRLRQRWLGLAWQAVEKAPEAQQVRLLKRIGAMCEGGPLTKRAGDITNTLKVWDQLPKEDRGDPIQNLVFRGMAATGRWLEAAEIFKTIVEPDAKTGSRFFLQSYLASSLRRAGREKEAASYDAQLEKLVLGDWDAAYQIHLGYDYGGDSERAALWLVRAVKDAPIGGLRNDSQWGDPLGEYAEALLTQGKWKEAAALGEVAAMRALGQEVSQDVPPAAFLAERLKVDLPHALSILETDRPGALRALADCHAVFASGGSLADSFFPALRQAGLIQQHDQWFEASWKIFSDRIETYPAADYLRNGAAWLAARSARRLDEAEKQATTALTLKPDEAAYLDTMAEVQFAKRDRKAAVKWSAQAVNYAPRDSVIRRQHERFANSPFPAN